MEKRRLSTMSIARVHPLYITKAERKGHTNAEINEIIELHFGWKGTLVTQLRSVVLRGDPELNEEVKWKMPSRPEGLAVWSHHGILCFAEIWKDNIKLLFPKGMLLKDPQKIFNARLKSKYIRAIEFKEGDRVNSAALQNLVCEAVKYNKTK